MKIDVGFVSPYQKWELWLNGFVKETGTGNVGLFVEAETEEEALKYLEALVKIIKENHIDFEELRK